MAVPISETTIQHHATSDSFSRGDEYYQRGAVTDLVQRGNTINAEVEGSEVAPYRVSLQFDAGGVTAARCSCPYDYEGWCKHIVATALTCYGNRSGWKCVLPYHNCWIALITCRPNG
jgi:uncharacterized Zn finger protein